MIAVVALSTGLELGIGTALWLGAIAAYARWDYRRICKRCVGPIQEELDELEDAWGFPPKWSPTKGDSHLGHPHVGGRR